ncbi:Mannose permease IID component [Clostridium tertium]|uniref:Mannose permease IID component n=1 Tax=Clostridium tertium TaxID=1559 RepID=A0A6N3G1U1_9CLOT
MMNKADAIVNNVKDQYDSKQLSKKDLLKVFFRSFTLEASFNYERMQSLGFVYSLIPVIKKLYKTKEERAGALKRHLEFFNTTPHISTFIMGITSAMEEQNAKNEDFNEESINAVKVGLMGPLAGIGDSLFWGTFRVIAAGVGTSLAMEGKFLGVILFLLLFNVPHLLIRYNATFIGYNLGNKFLAKMYKNNLLEKATTMASIVGLMVIGAMTATMIEVSTTLSLGVGESVVNIQEILDQILPGMLPLAITGLAFWMVKKNMKTIHIMIILMVIGVVGRLLGVI